MTPLPGPRENSTVVGVPPDLRKSFEADAIPKREVRFGGILRGAEENQNVIKSLISAL